jgi:hypothetical protein
MKNKLDYLEKEFMKFESSIHESGKLKTELDNLNTQGFESYVSIIQKNLSKPSNIIKTKKMILDLKERITNKEKENLSKLKNLLDDILKCRDHINEHDPEKLKEEYELIFKGYNELNNPQKLIVHDIIVHLHKKLEEKWNQN